MSVLVLFLDGASPFDAQIGDGLSRYEKQHWLGWAIQKLPATSKWRCRELAANWPGELAFVGMLHPPAVEILRQEIGDQPAWFLTCAKADVPDAWSAAVDDALIGRQAVDHMLLQGYSHLATWGDWSVQNRSAIFSAAEKYCNKRGVVLHRLGARRDAPSAQIGEQEVLANIMALPKPLGVISYQDQDAVFLRTFCDAHGLSVPDEIGILGVNDQVDLCESDRPFLSSVRTPWRQLGAELGRILHQLVAGVERPPRLSTVSPFGVSGRDSTARAAQMSSDKIVQRFLKLVGRRATSKALTVAACAKHCGVDRTTLFRRVLAATGRNPQDHLHDARIARACKLLRETDETLESIAEATGYSGAHRLSAAFKKRFPVSPGIWRKG